MLKRDYDLSEEDKECLDALGLEWEAIRHAERGRPVNWILIHDFEIPEGYNVEKADVALRLRPGYPDVDIDMAYFKPPLSMNNGKPITKVTLQDVMGEKYQQWSRHRPSGGWRPGIDNIGTHILQVRRWLARELKK